MITTSSETLRESTSSGSGRSLPFYVLHRDRLEANVRAMDSAFRNRYENFAIAFSFKTNYLKPIIEVLAENGCMAEVVSPYELFYAKALGLFDGFRYVYNGVIPDDEGKFKVAAEGGMVNIDNINEYRAISAEAARHRTKIDIGVRVNFEISNGLCSRFGIDIHSREFEKLFEELAEDEFVNFAGFHCHIGTARPAKYWKEKAYVMAGLAKKYGASYIDLGGGMYGPMIPELANQFAEHAKTYDEYAKAVCDVMYDYFPNREVQLIVEPGTALVGNTMDLYCHVTDIKDVRGTTYVTMDTCSNHLGMICECRTIPYHVIRTENSGERVHLENATIAGCTCLEFDYIRKNVTDDIAIGDMICFENVGAYSIGASRQFIVPRPAVVDSKTMKVLRTEETGIDMFMKYLRP